MTSGYSGDRRAPHTGPPKIVVRGWITLAVMVAVGYGFLLWFVDIARQDREHREGVMLAQCTANDGVFYKPDVNSDPICLKKDAVIVPPVSNDEEK